MFWIPILLKLDDDRKTTYASNANTFEDAVKNALSKHPSVVEYYHTPMQKWVKI